MLIFSVIIPTHNRANLLIKCLDSLVAQTFKNFEVIVVDDASTESISSVVDLYTNKLNITYIRNDNSMGGPARPRNIAINIASAPWIAFLDNDDWWYPDKLQEISKYLNSADVIYHELNVCDGNGVHLYETRSRQLIKPALVDLLVNGNALTNSSVVARKDLINRVGNLDESKELIAVEDYDLWMKLAALTEKFLFIDKILGGYYVGEGNISKSSEVQINRLNAVYSKNAKNLVDVDLKNANAALAYAKAHCYFKMRELKLARIEYCKALGSTVLMFKLKSLIRLIQILFL